MARLSWPGWLVAYRDVLPICQQSPIQVLSVSIEQRQLHWVIVLTTDYATSVQCTFRKCVVYRILTLCCTLQGADGENPGLLVFTRVSVCLSVELNWHWITKHCRTLLMTTMICTVLTVLAWIRLVHGPELFTSPTCPEIPQALPLNVLKLGDLSWKSCIIN